MNKVPLHFIYGRKIEDHIYEITDVDTYWQDFIDGRQIWILQSYCILRNYYDAVSLGNSPRRDAVNIIHANDIGFLNEIDNYYFVTVRADKKPVMWSNFEIVQNKLQMRQKASYVTHWPQPGLIKRKKSSTEIKNVAFLGAIEQNILRNYPIENDLRSIGIEYMGLDRANWHDYSNFDAALAIRSFGNGNQHADKPPSKLINAWRAEVPLLASNDSAYAQIGTPGEDYIVVDSYADLLEKISFLQSHPDYYGKIVENGIKKRERYSRDTIAQEWLNVFTNAIFPEYVKWNHRKGWKKFFDNGSRRTLRQYQRVTRKLMSVLGRTG